VDSVAVTKLADSLSAADPGSEIRVPHGFLPPFESHPLQAYKLRSFTAETEGFEPSRGVNPCLVSSEVLSTTQPRLQSIQIIIFSSMRQCEDKNVCSARFFQGVMGGRKGSASCKHVIKKNVCIGWIEWSRSDESLNHITLPSLAAE
jgi:hypothetical protein